MKHFMWAFLLLGFAPNVAAQNTGYTLDTAPWSNQKYEVCSAANENGLRAVIFEPEIEEWAYRVSNLPMTKLEVYENGMREVVVSSEKTLPAYFLKEQKIGYINKQSMWVDENGVQIINDDQLEIKSGKREQPKTKGSYEKPAYTANFELEYAAAMDKIHYEPPCTVFSVGHFHKLESETYFDFGENNPYQCDSNKGLKRGQKFNYSKKFTRPVVCCPDGSNYYVKLPDGEIKIYRAYHPIWEVLYKDDGSPICEWNDLGSIKGYELISPN